MASRLRPPRARFAGSNRQMRGESCANGLLAGIELQGWDVWADSSRGEVAQMLWNLWTMMDE